LLSNYFQPFCQQKIRGRQGNVKVNPKHQI
jgi:hypothetical protein